MVQRLHRRSVMHHVPEPRAYALDHLAIMRQLWHGVRDGDVESVHQARVATRRIRAALVHDLRKAQDTLGRMHDLHAMLHTIRGFAPSNKGIAAEVRILEAVMSSQLSELHQKYLPQRDRLHLICLRCDVVASRGRVNRLGRAMRRMLPAAGLVALPLVMWRISAASTDGSPT